MKRAVWLGGLAILVAGSAFAALSGTALTVGASSAACFPAIAGRPAGQFGETTSFLLLKNESSSASVAFALGVGALPTAALNTGGSITLPPGAEQVLATTQLRNTYMACIASSGSSPVTLITY